MKKALFVLMNLLFLPSCIPGWGESRSSDESKVGIGSGVKVTKNLEVKDFNKIKVNGQGLLRITQNDKESLQIEADDNIMKYIAADVTNETLIIEQQGNIRLEPKTPIVYTVSTKSINSIISAGSFAIYSPKVSGDELELTISGSTNIKLGVDIKELEVNVSGSSNIKVYGKTIKQEINSSGSTIYRGFGLESEEADVNISGSGTVELNVNSELEGQVAGAVKVYYKGHPEVKIEKLGAASINKV